MSLYCEIYTIKLASELKMIKTYNNKQSEKTRKFQPGKWRASMKKMTGRKVLSFAMASAMTMGMGTAAMAEETTTYPMDTDAKFVYWGEINGSVSANFNSLGDTEIGKDWQKNTGVTIEFQHPTAGQATEQFNLIIADGDYPDLRHRKWSSSSTYPGGPEKAMADGVILDLTDLIN